MNKFYELNRRRKATGPQAYEGFAELDLGVFYEIRDFKIECVNRNFAKDETCIDRI